MSNLSFDFSDQCVIVTGAARGIGLAIASFFKDAKATVLPALSPQTLRAASIVSGEGPPSAVTTVTFCVSRLASIDDTPKMDK